jgi:carotenoid 1,2-hydratase
VIALVGNPFSPSYARARARGRAPALDFAAMNVALYGPRVSAWTLHERAAASVSRQPEGITIGRSAMRWSGDALVVDVEERCVAFGGRSAGPLRGRVVVRPRVLVSDGVALTGDGAHRWWPVAPMADVEVDFRSPDVRFRGHGYHDANAGDSPLEGTFRAWHWLRARSGRDALLAYDVLEASGAASDVALRVRASGQIDALPTERVTTSRTAWGLVRHVRADAGAPARVSRALEDGPFYARALVETRLGGQDIVAMHETLDARRLGQAWVRFLARFRTRRGD